MHPFWNCEFNANNLRYKYSRFILKISLKGYFFSKECGNVTFFEKNKACTYVHISVSIEDISKDAPILKLWVQCKQFECTLMRWCFFCTHAHSNFHSFFGLDPLYAFLFECKNCRVIPIIAVKSKFVIKKLRKCSIFWKNWGLHIDQWILGIFLKMDKFWKSEFKTNSLRAKILGLSRKAYWNVNVFMKTEKICHFLGKWGMHI